MRHDCRSLIKACFSCFQEEVEALSERKMELKSQLSMSLKELEETKEELRWVESVILNEQGCEMIFMRTQISIETECGSRE